MNEWHDLTKDIKTKKIGAHDGAGFYLLRFDPEARLGPESHPQRETGVVLEGAVMLRLGFVDELVDGDDLSGFDVSPDEEHTITAGVEGAMMLVVARPDWPEAEPTTQKTTRKKLEEQGAAGPIRR